jgi:hypothetical protein
MFNRYATALVIAGGVAVFIGASAWLNPPPPERGAAALAPRPKPTTRRLHAHLRRKTLKRLEGEPASARGRRRDCGAGRRREETEVNTISFGGEDGRRLRAKAEYRITIGQQRIQYRSVGLADVGQWVLKGYQPTSTVGTTSPACYKSAGAASWRRAASSSLRKAEAEADRSRANPKR